MRMEPQSSNCPGTDLGRGVGVARVGEALAANMLNFGRFVQVEPPDCVPSRSEMAARWRLG